MSDTELCYMPASLALEMFRARKLSPVEILKAQMARAESVEPPRDIPYGQRRMLIRSPDGALIDISAPAAPPPGG